MIPSLSGDSSQTELCGEPLFQATPEPRRFPLARYILRHYAAEAGANRDSEHSYRSSQKETIVT